jgi:seryl-tRNA synthetase
MLPIQLFRTNKELILEGLKKKNFKELDLVEKIITTDEKRRALQVENDTLAASQNAAAKNIGQLMAKGDKAGADLLKKR